MTDQTQTVLDVIKKLYPTDKVEKDVFREDYLKFIVDSYMAASNMKMDGYLTLYHARGADLMALDLYERAKTGCEYYTSKTIPLMHDGLNASSKAPDKSSSDHKEPHRSRMRSACYDLSDNLGVQGESVLKYFLCGNNQSNLCALCATEEIPSNVEEILTEFVNDERMHLQKNKDDGFGVISTINLCSKIKHFGSLLVFLIPNDKVELFTYTCGKSGWTDESEIAKNPQARIVDCHMSEAFRETYEIIVHQFNYFDTFHKEIVSEYIEQLKKVIACDAV